MDPAPADFMRRHLRRHHLTLLPLLGSKRDMGFRGVVCSVGQNSAKLASSDVSPYVVTRDLQVCELEMVVAQCFKIMVSHSLQHLPVASTDIAASECFQMLIMRTGGKYLHV